MQAPDDADEAGVRVATSADATEIARIYAPMVQATVISFEEHPPEPAEMLRRMQTQPRLPWLVAEHGGKVVGYAYASAHRQRAAYRWSVDCSVYVDAHHRGRGIGRGLYDQLFTELRGLGYISLFAGVTLPNPASVGLHEALGFEPVGVYRRVGYKAGQWHDVGWWRKELAEPPDVPAEPRHWRA